MNDALPHVTRGGEYYRVCGPNWENAADTSYARAAGGRWNARGEFGALYLNANLAAAHANAIRFVRRIFGDAATPEDIEPAHLPELARFTVREAAWVDFTTEANRIAVGECVEFARRTYLAGENGIAATSAVATEGEELAVFDRSVDALVVINGARERFADWYRPVTVGVAVQPIAPGKKSSAKRPRKKKATRNKKPR